MPRGPFISLDGVDGTGKSTQCRLLADRLRAVGWPVKQCADPGGTAVGEILRDVLLRQRLAMTIRCEALLFMASRAQLIAEVVAPARDAGQAVVADRFLLANVVYQGHAGGLDPEQLWSLGRFATGGLEPDLTLVLDVPLAVARQRRTGPPDRVESRPDDFHERVRAGFRHEAQRQPQRIRVIDATGPVAEVHEEIWRAVSAALPTVAAGPGGQV